MRGLLVAAGASAAVSVAGRRAGALSNAGAVSAWAVGTAVVAGSSWRGAAVLGTFFVTSSALSRLAADERPVAAKGGRRDARQVLANGGVAGLGALAAQLDTGVRPFAVLCGALSAATSDTWATEIGATSPMPPRMLVSHRETPPGTSGGVTRRGLAASIAGATTIALATLVVAPARTLRLALAVTLAGVGGSLLDSLLGEMVQEQRYCTTCDMPTEAVVHHCGARTALVSGISGFDNDVVNLLATCGGAIIAATLA